MYPFVLVGLGAFSLVLCILGIEPIYQEFLQSGDLPLDYSVFLFIGVVASILTILKNNWGMLLLVVFYSVQTVFIFDTGFYLKLYAGFNLPITFYQYVESAQGVIRTPSMAVNLFGLFMLLITVKVVLKYRKHNKSIKEKDI